MARFILALVLSLACSASVIAQKVHVFKSGPSAIAEQIVVLKDSSRPVSLGDLQEKYQRVSRPYLYVLDYREGSRTARAYVNKKPPSDSYPYFFAVAKDGLILAQGEVQAAAEVNVAAKVQVNEKSADVPPRAVMLQLSTGQIVGGIVYVGGTQYVVTDVTIVKLADPTPPTPPTPVTSGPVWVTTIVDGRRVTPDQSSELIDLRDWLDKQDASKVRRFEFSPDAKNEKNEPDKRVSAWVSRIPEGDRGKPYVFVTQASTTDGKHIVLWQGPMTKAETLIEETKRRAKL